ncbi:MAG: hypothetical protein JW787_01065, partial [Sedimentisphaerales bacterium]|nr:hypothetical protein [Sedimentisphaerales bacterium]
MVEQINSIAQLWWNWMWPMFWQVSLLVIIIAIADLFLRKRVWPQVRYALWLLVLIKLIIPPGFALSTSIVSQIRAHMPPKSINVEPETAQSESSFKIVSENIVPETTPRFEPDTFPEKENFILPAESTSQSHISNPIIVSEKVSIDWKAWLMIGWLAGVIILLFWAITRYHALRRKFCTKTQKANIPKWFEPLLSETANRLKLRNIPKIAFSDNISSPAVFGTFNPVLVLPADRNLSQKIMEHILLHELAHIKRLDLKVNTLTTLLQIVYWFNPLLFFAGKRLRHLRELCCDATVARILREQTTDYRITIMESARRFFTKPTELGMGLLGLFEDSSSLANRLKWLEKKTWKYRTLQIFTVCTVVILMTLYILPMAKAKKVQAAENTIAQEEQTADSQIDPRERATLTGKIIDTQGKPVGKAEITLYKKYSVRYTNNVKLHKVGKTIISKDDGTFVLNTQKRLWMMNFRDELGSFEEGLVVVKKDGLALNWAKWDINEDKDINFTLTKSQSVDGIVVNETGKPVSGAQVRPIIYRGKDPKTSINDWLPGISPIEELETTSDNQGRFKINGIPENSYVDFVVQAKGKASVSTYKKELGPEFKSGQKNVRIILPDEGFIEGKIVDINTGKGIPGVQVIAIPHNPSEPVSGLPRFSSSFFEPLACVSNQEGIFKIGSLAEGYYGLTGEIPFKDKIFVEKGKAVTDINVDCKGYVHGYVKDAKGNPIINAEVQIRPPVESINIPKNATRIVTIIHNGKTDENGYYLVTDIGEYYTVGVVYYFNNDDNRGYRHIYT